MSSVAKQLFLGSANVGVEFDESHVEFLMKVLPEISTIYSEAGRGDAGADPAFQVKAADARDFEDEQELAEDLAPATPVATWNSYTRPAGWQYGQSTAAAQGDEFDYDAPAPSSTSTSAPKSTPTPTLTPAPALTPVATKHGRSTNATPVASAHAHQGKPMTSLATAASRGLVSAQRAPGGAILKFTDLFDTIPQRMAIPRSSAMSSRAADEDGPAVEEEGDESELFSSVPPPLPSSSSASSSSSTSSSSAPSTNANTGPQSTKGSNHAPNAVRGMRGGSKPASASTPTPARAAGASSSSSKSTEVVYEYISQPKAKFIPGGASLVGDDYDGEADGHDNDHSSAISNASDTPVSSPSAPLPVESTLRPVQFFPWEVDILWEDPENQQQQTGSNTVTSTSAITELDDDEMEWSSTNQHSQGGTSGGGDQMNPSVPSFPLLRRTSSSSSGSSNGNTVVFEWGNLQSGAERNTSADAMDVDRPQHSEAAEAYPCNGSRSRDIIWIAQQANRQQRGALNWANLAPNAQLMFGSDKGFQIDPQSGALIGSGRLLSSSSSSTTTTKSVNATKLLLDLTDENLLFEPADADVDDDDDEDEALAMLMKSNGLAPSGPRKRRHLHLPTRALSAGEILRRREEKSKQLDKFNLSNDKWYAEVSWQQDQRIEGAAVTHSNYAYKLSYAKTNLFKEELLTFHRPRGAPFSAGAVLRLTAPRKRHQASKKRSAHSGLAVIKSKRDLSAREGRVVLTEYTEEHPPVIMRAGMASAVRNYYRKKTDDDVPHLTFQDGEAVILEPKDESPFLGDVPKGTALQSLENNLFKVPLFRHEVKETDFLLVRHGDRFVVREVASLYCVAQIQPLVTVPAPRSRTAEEYVKKRLQQYVSHMFRERKAAVDKAVAAAHASGDHSAIVAANALEATVKISDITVAFPDQSDNSIRKCLKRMADYKRGGDDNGSWYLKSDVILPTEENLRSQVTLEEICCYESMLAAQQRLEEEGITKLIHIIPSLLAAVAAIPESSPKKRAAKFIEEELQLTPWNLTTNFIDAIRGKGLLQLTGLGDPSGRGEAFSYVRMPQKVAPKDAKEREREREPREKVVVTGTDRDLRKLSLQDTARVLQEFGVSDDEINKLHRWRRIALIRTLANKAKEEGDSDDMMTKFARGSRFTVLNQQLSYNEKCQKIFDNMLRALTDPDPVLSDDEDDEEALAGIGEKENQEDLEGLDALERAMAEEADADGDVDMDNNNNVSTTTPGGGGAAGRSVPGAPNLGASSNAAPGAPTVVQLETTDKHPSTYVRKIFRNPDGTVAREELIKDRETVERFLADPKYKKGRPNAKRPRMETEEEAERRQAIKREKRRVQEKNRRHRKNAEKQKELQKKFEAGGNTTDNHKNLKLRCGRCGMIGHMKTNRICPFFKSDDEGDEETDEKQAQRASRPRRAPTKKRGSRRGADDEDGEEDDDGMQLDDDSDDNGGGGGGDDESGTNPPMAKRRKLDSTRRNSPVGKLSEILLDVLRVVMVDPSFVDFKAAVKRAYAPDYYDIITNPMWLAKMREKCDQYQYEKPEDFLSDARLIRDNCHAYNADRNPELPPLSDALYDTLCTEIQKNATRIDQALASNMGSAQNSSASQDGAKPSISAAPGAAAAGAATTDDGGDGDDDDDDDDDNEDDYEYAGAGPGGKTNVPASSPGLDSVAIVAPVQPPPQQQVEAAAQFALGFFQNNAQLNQPPHHDDAADIDIE